MKKRIRAKLKDNFFEELKRYWTEDVSEFSEDGWALELEEDDYEFFEEVLGTFVVLIEDGADENGNMTYVEETDNNWIIPERCIEKMELSFASKRVDEIIGDLLDFSKTIRFGTSIHENNFREIIYKLQKLKD